ncbi:nudix hydrolase 17, mitochondrial [Ipomoea triloba]|uniref:nudix hydrolase 17, mitochondrial n=1 Tax=Ipomoea triloba TaxID=35885 RepID=UPI00125DA949|nr:nudix hydrolase 17, mitochondrial [Ipomoea triloba]GLL32877.1 nudix hydrolase 17, mitochondrial-like [Ipomoea trifida]GMD26593.1 nudix hydrolase 17, mitochondrial-like [Ipomoea batatas]
MVVCMVSRTGRNLQRYNKGQRLVVGCIPYRYTINDELEVLMISSQKGQAMMFPKGGWELDESVEEAASRESIEEAGVLGIVEPELGKWIVKSKSRAIYHEGYMFPLLVTEQLDLWPEKNLRRREWMSVTEAREVCKQIWMKEALDMLVERINSREDQEDVFQSSP